MADLHSDIEDVVFISPISNESAKVCVIPVQGICKRIVTHLSADSTDGGINPG